MTSADADARLRAAWGAAGVVATPPPDDATWLRRLWIDVAGTVPSPEAVRGFLADRSADKRARAIDALLASPRWADHWTAYWDDVWMGRDRVGPDVDPGAFRAWLHDALARNEPWNEVVTKLLTATGRNSAGVAKRDADENDGRGGVLEGVNGAVNWTLKYQDDPQDLAGAASRTLLGVQIQCAQCHDHKTEKWTQKDFQGFAAAFVRTRLEPVDRGKAMGVVRRVDSATDLARPAPRYRQESGRPRCDREGPADGARRNGPRRRRRGARGRRALGDGPGEPLVRARLRQPHVGALPRPRLRRSR